MRLPCWCVSLLLPLAGCAESPSLTADARDDAGTTDDTTPGDDGTGEDGLPGEADADPEVATDDAGGCRPGWVDCSGTCVDTDSDPGHCGGCGLACDPGMVCNEGACASTCSSGLENCLGACVDLQTDPRHCGLCGRACADREECRAGSCACVPACGGRECGDDGCGGSCGDCPAGSSCGADGRCACVPACGGRECGDDGCGGSCGGCDAGRECDAGGRCVCDDALPPGWPSDLRPWAHNPLLVPTRASAVHGEDNVYAPDIHRWSDVWIMFYGGQGGDGHDRIFLAWSRDGMDWRKYANDDDPRPVLDVGSSNHVNDPSTVLVGSTWRMYYTDAPVGIDDRIWLAEATNVRSFAKVGEVLGPGPAGSWESQKVGRPSVLYEGGTYKMWYDGNDGVARHVGYATSADGRSWTRHPGNPVFLNAGAIDVQNVGGVYVMLREAGDGTYWATSVDGTCWVDRGRLFGLSGAAYDAYGQVTPHLQLDGGAVRAVWYGGASVSTWNRNRIAAAFPGGTAPAAGGGCSACLTWGWSCALACQGAGFNAGFCGAPGSTSPGACCACADDGCQACTPGFDDCQAACVGAGRAGGWCAYPGSTDTGRCCACLP
jgi:hypothetical protein